MSFFKKGLYLIIKSCACVRKNLHILKININFVRFLSGKVLNIFSKILKIVHFAKST